MGHLRIDRRDRKQQVIDCFITVAKRKHYNAVKRDEVAFEAGISKGLVTRYFSESMRQLRVEAVEHAVENGVIEIIIQSLIIKDTSTANLTTENKNRVVEFVRGIL